MKNSYIAILLANICLVFTILSLLFINKIVRMPILHQCSASVFIIPLMFCCVDIITEIYGYKLAKKILSINIITLLVFIILGSLFTHFPIPNTLKNWSENSQIAYDYIFNNLLFIYLIFVIALIIGLYINVIILTKLYVITSGRWFIIRCICASSIGELVFTSIGVTFIMFKRDTSLMMLKVIIFSYLVKIIFNIIYSLISNYIIKYIRKIEHLTSLSTNYNHNPFKN